jgi:hypothetical protein
MNLIYKAFLFIISFNSLYSRVFGVSTPSITSVSSKIDSVSQLETAVVNGMRYTAVNFFNDKAGHNGFYIKDAAGKIVYSIMDSGIIGFKFVDFNEDGFKDVTVELRGVDSGGQDLVIYDPKSKTFKLAGNCSNAEKISNTKFYYTYEDCCMGRNWSSDMFYIANAKIINVAHIKYQDGEGLSFYKLKGSKNIFIEKWKVRINGNTPVSTGRHIDFDLGEYWMKHWHGFAE